MESYKSRGAAELVEVGAVNWGGAVAAVVLCSKALGVAAHVREVAPAVREWGDAVQTRSKSAQTAPSETVEHMTGT